MSAWQRNDNEQTNIPASNVAKVQPDYHSFDHLRERKESWPTALVELLRRRGSADLALVGSLAALLWIGGRAATEIDKPLGCVAVVCIAVMVTAIGLASHWKGESNGPATEESSDQSAQSGNGGVGPAETRKPTAEDGGGQPDGSHSASAERV